LTRLAEEIIGQITNLWNWENNWS